MPTNPFVAQPGQFYYSGPGGAFNQATRDGIYDSQGNISVGYRDASGNVLDNSTLYRGVANPTFNNQRAYGSSGLAAPGAFDLGGQQVQQVFGNYDPRGQVGMAEWAQRSYRPGSITYDPTYGYVAPTSAYTPTDFGRGGDQGLGDVLPLALAAFGGAGLLTGAFGGLGALGAGEAAAAGGAGLAGGGAAELASLAGLEGFGGVGSLGGAAGAAGGGLVGGGLAQGVLPGISTELGALSGFTPEIAAALPGSAFPVSAGTAGAAGGGVLGNLPNLPTSVLGGGGGSPASLPATPNLPGTNSPTLPTVPGSTTTIPPGTTIPGTGVGGAVSQIPQSVLGQILRDNGINVSDSTLGLIGQGLSGVLGYVGSQQQAGALNDLAARTRADREPFRQAALGVLNNPGGSPVVQNAIDQTLRQLSVQGNPFGNPYAQAMASTVGANTAMNQVNVLGGLGLGGQGIDANLSTQAINADQGGYGILGSMLGQLTTPRNNAQSYMDLARSFGLV